MALLEPEGDTDASAQPIVMPTRELRGEPLLVWGEYSDDALRIRSQGALMVTLDGLHDASAEQPLLVRLWTAADEQVVVAMSGDETALYLVHGYDGACGASIEVRHVGNTEAFELADHGGHSVEIPWVNCVTWAAARRALLRFVEHGDLGVEIQLDGGIPSPLLWLGEIDRAAELATRPPPPGDPALSSLPRRTPCGRWAHRLIASMVELGLIEIDAAATDAIVAALAVLLQQRGMDAVENADEAERLANDLSRVRGVGAVFGGSDIQVALRRTVEPATQPIAILPR